MGGMHPLLSWLDHTVPADPRERTFVLCSSPMGAGALRRALTERRGALLGVDFVTAAGLARKLLLLGGQTCSDDLPDPLEEREALRRSLTDDSVGRYAKRFDRALARLHETIREVQTLGPVSAGAKRTPDAERVLELAQAVEADLARNAPTGGRGGRSRWIAAATLAAADGEVRPPSHILVASYPRLERDLELLLQVLRDRGVTVREFVPPERQPGRVQMFSSPDPATELRLAARECLSAGARGVPWHAMVVAAPRLHDYAADLARSFAAEGVPFQTAITTPLIQYPRIALAVHGARLLFERAPRASFLALATSHLLRDAIPLDQQLALETLSRYEALQGTGAPTAQFADRLEGHFRDPAPHAAGWLRSVLEYAERARECADNFARGELLREFLAAQLQPVAAEDETATHAEHRLDDCLRALVFADPNCESGADFVRELCDVLQRRTIPLPGQTRGGVPIVTYREALAFPAQHLHLLGMASSMVPGSPPVTTFLSDSDRESLGLLTSEIARSDEEQQLETLAGHADNLTLSYPRRDGNGTAQELTLWTDRLRRVVDLPEMVREPGHPQSRAERAVASGRCAKDLARDHLALGGCRDAGLFRELVDTDAARVLHRTTSLESFDPSQLARDGDVGQVHGERLASEPVSVTDFGLLGQCPQQFLFRRGMHIRPLPEEPDPLGLPRDRMGTMIHRVVEKVYAEFLETLQTSEDPRQLTDRLADRAVGLLRSYLERDTSILSRDFPGLHELITDRWAEGLRHSIAADLALMHKDGGRPHAVEQKLTGEVAVRRPSDSEPIQLSLIAQIDRIDALPDERLRVLDFKTGAAPQYSVKANNIFKGTNLQLILYGALLRAARQQTPSQLEIRSLRPGIPEPDAELRLPLSKAPNFFTGEEAVGVQETLAILGRLMRRGAFAPSINQMCAWCRFKPACRRYHPPSAERVARTGDPELLDFAALRSKSWYRQVLDDRRSRLPSRGGKA